MKDSQKRTRRGGRKKERRRVRHAAEQFGRFGCLAGLEGLAGLESLESLVVPAGREDLLLFSTTAKERQGVVSPGIHTSELQSQ